MVFLAVKKLVMKIVQKVTPLAYVGTVAPWEVVVLITMLLDYNPMKVTLRVYVWIEFIP